MKALSLNSIAKFSLIIFFYLLLYYFFAGIISKPWEGDSLAYHIPIAEYILHGNILNPFAYIKNANMSMCPGASELILSIFLFLHIPLNIYNVVGYVVLFFVMRLLAKTYGLSSDFSTIFATSIATLHVMVRWILAQTIDMWLAIFFGLSLILLQKPQKTWQYFLKLGFALGMLVGSKYTGPAFALFLLLIYGKNVLTKLNISRFFAFLIPFTLFGLFWYIRNFILTGDPYYPQSILFFKGVEWHILDYAVWKILLFFPGGFNTTLQAFIGEYMFWSLSLIITPALLFITWNKLKTQTRKDIGKLVLLGLLNFAIYFSLPSGQQPNLMTTGFRYTYPAFIPLILCLFLFAKNFHQEEMLSIVALTNMLILPELSYHPKILIGLIPIALIIFYPSKIQLFYQKVQKMYTRKRMQF